MHVCVRTCVCVCVCVHMCTCVCMCVRVCTCVCMCVRGRLRPRVRHGESWRWREHWNPRVGTGRGAHTAFPAQPLPGLWEGTPLSQPRGTQERPLRTIVRVVLGLSQEPGKGSREGIGEAAAGQAHQVRPQARAGCGGGGAAGRGDGRGWALPAPALSPRWEPHQDLAHTWPACSHARSSAARLRDGVDPGARVAFLSHALLPHLVPLFSRYHLRPIEWVRQFLRGSGLAGKTPGLVGGRRGRG